MALEGDEYVIHIRPDVNPTEFRAATDLALDAVEHEFAESGGEAGRRFSASFARNAALGMRAVGVQAANMGFAAREAMIPLGVGSAMAAMPAMAAGGLTSATGGLTSALAYRTPIGYGLNVPDLKPSGEVSNIADEQARRAGRGTLVNTGFGRLGYRRAWDRHGPGWQFTSGMGPPGGYMQRAGFAGLFGGPWGVAGVAVGGLALGGAMAYNYSADADAAERRAFQMYGTEIDDLSTQTERWTKLLGAARHELFGISEGLLQVLVPLEQNRAAAEGLSLQFSDIASKLALFKNADALQVGRAIQRGLVGEFETLKTYHIPITRNQILGQDPANLATYGKPLPFGPEYNREFLRLLEQYARPASLYQPPETQRTVRGLEASAKEFAVGLGRFVEPVVTPIIRGLTDVLEYYTPGNEHAVPTSGLDFQAADRLLTVDRTMRSSTMHSALLSHNPIVGYWPGTRDAVRRGPGYMSLGSGVDRETAEQILFQLTETQNLGRRISSRAEGKAYTDALRELGFETSRYNAKTRSHLDPESLTPAIERWTVAVENLTLVEERRADQEDQNARDRAELDYQDRKHRIELPERNLIAYNQWREEFRADSLRQRRWTSFVDRARIDATMRHGQATWNRTLESIRSASLSQAQAMVMSGFEDRLNWHAIEIAKRRQQANEAVGTYGAHINYNQIFRALKELGPGRAGTYGSEDDVARGQLVQQAFGVINALPDSMRSAYLADLPRDLSQYGISMSTDIQRYISTAAGAISQENALQERVDAIETAMKNALVWFENQYPESEQKLMRLAKRPATIEGAIQAGLLEFFADSLKEVVEEIRRQSIVDFYKNLPPGILDFIATYDFGFGS